MRKLLLILITFSTFGCKSRMNGNKYYISIKTKDNSILGLGIETKLDSVIAPNITSAYDSLSKMVTAFRISSELAKHKLSDYVSGDVLDSNGISVLAFVPINYKDSLDKEREKYYKNEIMKY